MKDKILFTVAGNPGIKVSCILLQNEFYSKSLFKDYFNKILYD